MPCDTRLKRNQTISERKIEILKATEKFVQGIKSGSVKVKVDPKGGIVFTGISDEDRDGLTDACAYRRVMASGSAMAIAAIARAEQMAGRSVDKQLVGQGYHSHDGGKTWHDHKG